MQQIAKFDYQLNYVPYRYRNRSNTNPKKTAIYANLHSYSRGKPQKHNPQKAPCDNMPQLTLLSDAPRESLREDLKRLKMMLQARDEKPEKKYEQPSIQSEYHSQSEHQEHEPSIERIDESISEETDSPIKKLSISHKVFPQENKETVLQDSQKVTQNDKANVPQTKISSIFNDYDVQQIKSIILQNIRHSQSQNQLQSDHTQPTKITNNHQIFANALQENRLCDEDEPKKDPDEVNLHDLQFNRNLKRREVIKNIKKIRSEDIKRKLQFFENNHPKISVQKVDHLHKQEEAPEIMVKTQKSKEQMLNKHNSSINTTTNSSQQRQKEDRVKSSQILTFDKYKQNIKEKKQFKYDSHCNQYLPIKNKEQNLSYSYFLKNKVQKMSPIKQRQSNPVIIQQAKTQISSNLLDQFNKQARNETINLIRQAKSKQKVQKQQYHCEQLLFSYANRQPTSSRANQSVNQSYSRSMKKKKQKSSTFPNVKTYQSSLINDSKPIKYLEKIQEQTCSINDHEQLKDLSHQQGKELKNAKDQGYHGLMRFNRSQNEQLKSQIIDKGQGLLAESDIEELQIGIALCLKSQKIEGEHTERQEPNQANRTHSHSSYPTSKVYEHHGAEELRSDDGEELLKIMAVGSNFKELSSLILEDRSPEHHDLSLASQQLCEIINSNQSEFSATPTPQNVSMSSQSIHYNFEQSEGEQGFKRVLQESRNGETIREDSALIQINEDSNVFPQPLIVYPQSTQNILSKAECKIDLIGFATQGYVPSQSHLSSHRSTQAQIDAKSIRDFRNHFHPSEAIRRYKHGKHNSADFKQKSLKSVRINHSVSTIRGSKLSLQFADRVQSRLEKNKARFRTTLGKRN